MTDHNIGARKVTIFAEIAQRIAKMPDGRLNDRDWFVEVGRRLGDVAYTIQYADHDLLDPLMELSAAVNRWMEDLMAEAAR